MITFCKQMEFEALGRFECEQRQHIPIGYGLRGADLNVTIYFEKKKNQHFFSLM